MCVNRTATFEGPDGKPKSVTITAKHIDALLAHAGNRAIPMHDTHEWFSAQGKANADSVEMNARVGALKNFRKDGAGDLIADAVLKSGGKRDDILFGARENPEDNCFSVVFSYDKSDPECIPQNFRAADLVPSGAATTALFSESDPNQNQNTSMDISEFLAALDDPKVKAALKAIMKSHQDAPDPADAAADDSAASEMESAADVQDEDKKPEDDAKPALMRAAIRVARSVTRQTAALKTAQADFAKNETALLAKAATESKAAATALLGKGGFIQQGAKPAEDGETFITAQLANGCKTRAHAIARMAKDKPELYATFRA